MILHRNPWQYRHGAAHRKNVDTPPLTGACWSAIKRSKTDTEDKRLTAGRSALERLAALQGALTFRGNPMPLLNEERLAEKAAKRAGYRLKTAGNQTQH